MAILTDKAAATVVSLADLIHIVDVSDTSGNSLGTSKKASLTQLAALFGGGASDYLSLTDTPGTFTNGFFVTMSGSALVHTDPSTYGLSNFNNDSGFITSNLTHTGEVTGGASLTVDPTAISNKALITAAGAMELLVNDAGTLKKVVASDFLGGGSDGNGIYDGSGSLSGNTTISLGSNNLTFTLPTFTGTAVDRGVFIDGSNFDATNPGSATDSFKIDNPNGDTFRVPHRGGIYVNSDYENLGRIWNRATTKGLELRETDCTLASSEVKFSFDRTDNKGVVVRNDGANKVEMFLRGSSNNVQHWLRYGDSFAQASFFINGFSGKGFNVGGGNPLGTEDISLQGETRIGGDTQIDGDLLVNQGAGESKITGTTPNTRVFLENSAANAWTNFRIAGQGNDLFLGAGGSTQTAIGSFYQNKCHVGALNTALVLSAFNGEDIYFIEEDNAFASPTINMTIKGSGTINMSNLASFADNTAATGAGAVVGDLYIETTSGNNYVAIVV